MQFVLLVLLSTVVQLWLLRDANSLEKATEMLSAWLRAGSAHAQPYAIFEKQLSQRNLCPNERLFVENGVLKYLSCIRDCQHNLLVKMDVTILLHPPISLTLIFTCIHPDIQKLILKELQEE